MSNLFWLTKAQMARLQPFFPKSHGKPRVDDRRILSGRHGRLSVGRRASKNDWRFIFIAGAGAAGRNEGLHRRNTGTRQVP